MKLIVSEHSSYETGATYYKDGDRLIREVWGTRCSINPKAELKHLIATYNRTASSQLHTMLDVERRNQDRHVIEAIATEFGFDISKAIKD